MMSGFARGARRWAPRLAIGAVLSFGGVGVLARLVYRRFLYPAPRVDRIEPPPGGRILELRAEGGVPVHAMELPNAAADRTVVYFHGNGESIGDDVWMAERLVARGFAVTLAEYRGYGRSYGVTPAPTEEGLYADAVAVLDDLAARGVGPERIVLWGTSLGTGVAVEMARRGRGGALVLVAPYTSVVDVGAYHVPFLPVSLVMGDRFDSLSKAAALRLPTVVVHGTEDEVIPFFMGERMASAIEGSLFEPIAGAHHMDCFLAGHQLLNRVYAFLTRAR